MAAINSNSTSYGFGPFRLIPDEHQLLRDGTPIPLPPKTFETLVLLVENSGHLIEKDQLMQTLWPDSFVEEANLTHHIWTLRKALGNGETGQPYIQTVPRKGYRFVAQVRKSTTPDTHTVKPIVSETSQQEEVLGNSLAAEGKIGRLRSLTRAGAILLLSVLLTSLLGVGYFVYNRIRSRATVPKGGKVVLLVLPFENASGNPEEQYFSDGMTEEMITELANLRPERLRVMPRPSAARIKSSGKDIYQMARELGVDYVLESSIYRFDDRIRINARLISTRDDGHVWARSYERELRDVLSLQNQVARSISQEIALQLNSADQIQPAILPQINPEAHEAYLKGLFYFDKFSEVGMKTSIEYLQQAIENEPGYAPPYARMARAYGVLGNLNSVRPEEAYPKQRESALKALEIDGRLSEARAALGWTKLFYDRDWNGAREEFERAIQLTPNYAIAHQGYAIYLVSMGEFDRAEAEILQAQQLDPVNLNIKCDVGWILYFARRTDESIVRLKEVLAMDPDYSIAYVYLALSYQQKGMFEEAIVAAQKSVDLFEGNEQRLANLGVAYARAGKKQEARSILGRLEKVSRERYISPYNTGLIYASLGQNDEALDWLEKAYNDRFWMMAFLKVDPRWDQLRSHPRFMDILRRTGLASRN